MLLKCFKFSTVHFLHIYKILRMGTKKLNTKSLASSQNNCYLAVLQTGRWMKTWHRFDNEIYLPLKLKIIKTNIIVSFVRSYECFTLLFQFKLLEFCAMGYIFLITVEYRK